ncbi:hypothetical protein C8Q78DRAFT_1079103 [Trametes maxima]|nr:hypothetical protein C8Q78DRAFT_1079103 [Trametes maxima]
MNSNMNQTPTSKKQDGESDAASFISTSSTLYDGKNSSSPAKTSKGQVTKGAGDSKLGASTSSFAKKAKEEGWNAPTATKPSFG